MRPDKASLCLLCVVSSRCIAHHLEMHAKLLWSWYSSHGHIWDAIKWTSSQVEKGRAARSPQSFWALSEGCVAKAFSTKANKAGSTGGCVYMYCHLPSWWHIHTFVFAGFLPLKCSPWPFVEMIVVTQTSEVSLWGHSYVILNRKVGGIR